MKRFKNFLCVLLLISLLSATGCTKETPQDSDQNEDIIPQYYLDINKKIESSDEGEYELPWAVIYDKGTCGWIDYYLESITTIVKATYKTTKKIDRNYLHCFNVIDCVRGDNVDEIIYLPATSAEYCCFGTDIPYEKDKNYLLLLQQSVTPYFFGNYYSSALRSDVIPLTEDGEPDMEKARMCNGEFVDSIKDDELRLSCKEGNFLECLLKKIDKNPQTNNLEGFKDTLNLKEAVIESEYILEVNISSNKHPELSDTCLSKLCYVEPTEVIKTGDVQMRGASIIFPSCAVNNEDKVIIMVNRIVEGELERYVLSTWNSIHPLSMKEEIIKILNEAK